MQQHQRAVMGWVACLWEIHLYMQWEGTALFVHFVYPHAVLSVRGTELATFQKQTHYPLREVLPQLC